LQVPELLSGQCNDLDMHTMSEYMDPGI
jgi:hypothetical protein